MTEKTKKGLLTLLDKVVRENGPLDKDPDRPPCTFFMHQPQRPVKNAKESENGLK